MNSAPLPAVIALRDYTVADAEVVNSFPRWSGQGLRPGQGWLYPPSHLLRTDLREILRSLLPDDEDYRWAHDRYEYRAALTQHHLHSRLDGYPQSTAGEFLSQWGAEQPRTETEFRGAAVQEGDDWPWWPVVGGADRMETTLVELRRELTKLVRFA